MSHEHAPDQGGRVSEYQYPSPHQPPDDSRTGEMVLAPSGAVEAAVQVMEAGYGYRMLQVIADVALAEFRTALAS